MTMTDQTLTRVATDRWVSVCTVDRLTPNRGSAAMIDGTAVAVFRLANGELYAIGNVDPCSGVSVLSRGIVGDVDGAVTVASPLYKQRFELTTGRCLDGDTAVAVHDVRIVDGLVEIRLADQIDGT